MSERGASIAAGLSPSQIRTMRRQHRLGLQRGASVRTITRLAQALGTTPEWLMLGAGQQESTADQPSPNIASPAGLHVAGVVGAGLWIETGTDSNEPLTLHVPADPRYPAQNQSAYEIRGTSTDKFARPGDFLIVVDRAAVGLPLRSGDIVLVTRIKKDLREVTARRSQRSNSDCELHFGFTDPRYNNWLVLPNDLGDDAVVLGGIAVGVYRPLT